MSASGRQPRAARAGCGRGLGACGVSAVLAASQAAGGAALPGGAALWVWVGEVCEQVCGRGSEELCLGGPGLLEGGWRHQRASHAEAAGLAGAAATGVSKAVPSAGLTSAWKW